MNIPIYLKIVFSFSVVYTVVNVRNVDMIVNFFIDVNYE